MKEKPILSVIIPTKNNAYYAERSVRAIVARKDKNIEVVLQDNGTNTDLKRALQDLILSGDIIYNYSNENLSVVGNFNLALEVSKGEYVCFIGDDDGIHPEIINVTKWAKKNQIETIVPKLNVVYFWPGSSQKHNYGYLSITPFTGNITRHNPYEQLLKLLNAGCLGYLNYFLPKAYHGIVSRKKLNAIRDITGNYFGGLTPDIYAVTALSLIVDEVVYIDFPLTISGISPKSNSGKAARNETNGRLEDAPHLKGLTDYNWSKNVPRIFSGETIWTDTLMHALDDMKRSDLKVHFNPEKLYERLWFRYGNLRKQLKLHYGKPKMNFNYYKALFNDTAKKIPIIVSAYMKYKGIVIEKDVEDMESAVSLILNSKYSSINLRSNIKKY